MKQKSERILKSRKGITLIALVITIIVLIILAGVSLYLILGQNGIIKKATIADQETVKQTATEAMNLKITSAQINTYAEKLEMPTLQELADEFCNDNDFEYVELQSKKVASLPQINVGTNSSIFTKLKEYPYEFEINSSLQLASIDGVQIATAPTSGTNTESNTIYKNMGEPDFSSKINIIGNSSQTNQYTVNKPGYIIVPSVALKNGARFEIYINDVLMCWLEESGSSWYRNNVCIPVASGNRIYYSFNNNGSNNIDGVIYFVPCVESSNQNNNEYSTESQIIGKWINGKPIYRKVYHYNSTKSISANNWNDSEIIINDVENIIDVKGFGGQYGVYSSIQGSFNGTVGVTENHLALYSPTVLYLDDVIIEYTKTTDTL